MSQITNTVVLSVALLTMTSGCRTQKPTDENGGSGDQTPALSQAEFEKAISLKNRGIGHLENKEWAEAEDTLSELAKLLPENRLALRDLAICRVLTLVDRGSPFQRSGSADNLQKFQQAVSSARTAVDNYQNSAASDYDKALARMLLGRLLIFADSPDSASFESGIQNLRDAADAIPEAADFRFAVAMAMDGNRDYADANSPRSVELLEALQKSFELAPENLFALQKLMQRQALFLNSEIPETKQQALKITDTLATAKTLLAPLNESILQQRNLNLIETIDNTLANFDGQQTSTLMRTAMTTGHLLLPEIATQIDQRKLNRDLLEYLLLDFDELFLTAAKEAGVEWKSDETVLKGFASETLLPDLNDVGQLQALDFDLDGRDDLILIRAGRIEIYSRSDGVEGDWKLLLASPEDVEPMTGFILMDLDRDYDKAISELTSPRLLLDRDGDRKIVTDPAQKNRWFDADYDIIAWGESGAIVLRNETNENGQRELQIVPQQHEVSAINDAIAADIDADGDLDVVFATRAGLTLWQNTDGTSFLNINASASLTDSPVQKLVAVDWDHNVAMDVVGVAVNGTKHGFLQNLLHNRYRWVSDETGLDDIAPAASIAIGQLDGHGSWDVVTAGSSGLQVTFMAGGNQTSTAAVSTTQLATSALTGVHLADIDNDGRSDVIAWGAESMHLFRAVGRGKFEDLSNKLNIKGGAKTATTNDLDEDGDLDILYVTNDGTTGVLINDGGNSNHWITVVARGKPDDPQFVSRRVNAHAIGSVIQVRCGTQRQSLLISDAKVHIGLGQCTSPESIRILWTDGIPQHITSPELLRPDIGVLAPQILKGSCPYIYTWTGERFEFFSDCLWAAPLGLVQANGEIAPTREWENLLIPGEALVPESGEYVLQLTEELWETAYFDHVQLTAIDHPADVSIFTNEKVGPPALAEHRVHTVQSARPFLSVKDGRDRDLTSELKSQDGNYIQAFQRRVMQGLTDNWTMEFDPGDLSGATSVRLFLIGWVFPTDTSLNLGIQQNESLNPPAPPSIEVPDGNGGWKLVRPFIGFPSGKTKAMAVDISDIFDGSDHRFRIRSSMELYWDQAFLTVDEDDAETVSQVCNLQHSHLHFRGFSRRIYDDQSLFRNGHAPESYDYQSVTTKPRWPTIAGRFTRYGQTDSLLADHDDKLVVMGPGDELTLRFAVPAQPVPDGWKRDFVLTNIGYDKDADLNTIYGQSSEPFPFRAMSRYPFAAEDKTPDSPEYHDYLNEWQTREYSTRSLWNARQPVE